MVDFVCREAGLSMTERPVRISQSDVAEIALRSLAAHVYFQRSGDKARAEHMLAVHPPGSASGVAPSWLVSKSSLHSTYEQQTSVRVRESQQLSQGGSKNTNTSTTSRGGGTPKGGKPKGRGRGSGQNSTQG